MKRYSIIIPTLNEENVLGNCLENISKTFGNAEIIIADGGSFDSTLSIAEKYTVKIVHSAPGRGKQFNAGLKASTGDILIFLHADTLLPGGAYEIIEEIFKDDIVRIATFKLKFDTHHPLLSFYSYFTRFDSLFTTFGDQAIIVRRNFIENLDGFKNYKIFEDVELFQRARKVTKIEKLNLIVITSARRFKKHGIIKTQILNLWYIIRYLLGNNVDDIYDNYFMKKSVRNKNAVLVFVKLPVEGEVKTRLARTTGNRFAALYYKICAENIISELDKLDNKSYKVFLFYENENNRSEIVNWIDRPFDYIPQAGVDLGERISNAFKSIFSKDYKKAVIIGSDIPDITAEYIDNAVRELQNYDVVISPSPDGGYNLLALRKFNPSLFKNIEWSSENVLEKTIKLIKELKLNCKLLEPLIDIDDESDLQLWIKKGSNIRMKEIIKIQYENESVK